MPLGQSALVRCALRTTVTPDAFGATDSGRGDGTGETGGTYVCGTGDEMGYGTNGETGDGKHVPMKDTSTSRATSPCMLE